MDTNNFLHTIRRIKAISPSLEKALAESIAVNRYEPNETFLSPGHYANALYYIDQGVIKGAVEGPAERMTTWFREEGDFFIPQGLFSQQTSQEYVSAILRTTLFALSLKSVTELMGSFPEMPDLIIRLLSEQALTHHRRELLLRVPAARDRYLYLAKHTPNLLKRVPHYLLASYMNITKETFSRLNKGLPY